MKKLLVFDSHPVQYRVPIWQQMNRQVPGCIHVAYATDISTKGHADKEFGKTFAWDEPLLSGYNYTVLNSENGEPLTGWNSLTGRGVNETLDIIQPDAVLLTGLNYRFDWVALLAARKRKIPVWLRCETQDFATPRSKKKQFFRSLIYKALYKKIDHFFYIGELNKLHYQKLGIPNSKLSPALYGTVYRYENMGEEMKLQIREQLRKEEGIGNTDFVIGFSGKLIFKKNPDIVYKMLQYLSDDVRKRVVVYFIGSGELEAELKIMADSVQKQYGVRSVFKGFVNQSKIGNHYLALDILILPSRLMGETWGLVVNEALQAGCSVIISEAVGSGKNFGNLQRFKIFKVEDSFDLSQKVQQLHSYTHSFNWALKDLEPYSIQSTAQEIIKQML